MAKFSNMLKMLFLLQKNKKMTIKELADELEVSEKQVRRYKTELEISGIYIKSLPGVNGGYRLENKIDIPININVKHNLEYLKYFDEDIRDELALELVSENSYQVDKLVKYLSRDTADKIIYDTLLNDDFPRNIFVDEFINIVDCVSSEVAEKLAIKMFTQGCKEYEVLYPYISNQDIKKKIIDLMINNKKINNIATIYNDMNERQLYKFSKILIDKDDEDILIKNKKYIRKSFLEKAIYRKVFSSIKMNLASITLFIAMLLSTFVLVTLLSHNHYLNSIPKNILIANNVYPTVEQLNELNIIYNNNLTFIIDPYDLKAQISENCIRCDCVGVVATNSNFIKNNVYETDIRGYVSKYYSTNEKVMLLEGEVWENGTDKNVVVIDTVVKELLRINDLDKDQYLKIGDIDYLIIGIINESDYSKKFDYYHEDKEGCSHIDRVFIPYKSYLKNINLDDYNDGKLDTLIKISKNDKITEKDVKNIQDIGGIIKEGIGEDFRIESHITENSSSNRVENVCLVVAFISILMIFIHVLSLIFFIKRSSKKFKYYRTLFNEDFNRSKVFTLYVFVTGVIFGTVSYILNLIISNNFYSFHTAYNIYYPSFLTFRNLLIISLVNVSIVLVLTFLTYKLTYNKIKE